MSCRLPFLGLLPRSLSFFFFLVPLRSRNSITLMICQFTASFHSTNHCQELGRTRTFFDTTRHTGSRTLGPPLEDLVVRKRDPFDLRFRRRMAPDSSPKWPRDKLSLADFARYATRSERWLAVGPAWDRALGVPLFPESSVGGDKRRLGDCIVDRGPRIWAGYHHPARPTDWTHFLVSKRENAPRGEEGVERRYAAASNLQGFVQGGSEDSDSQLQER